MSSSLLQIKIEPSLKLKLQRIAMSKGLNVTSYVKMTLMNAAGQDEDLALTENGFTIREEKRLLKSATEGKKEYKKGKLSKHSSMSKALASLQ